MINWIVRFKNKTFWLTLIPAFLVLITQTAELFGFTLDLTAYQNQLKNIIETIFLILSLFGIVNDPTTKGLSDSTNALTYTKPKE